MPTDYEKFLLGCYSAVVEIDNTGDLYMFINLMEQVGFKVYADRLREIDRSDDGVSKIFQYAERDGIKRLCFEYQCGKGFTYGDAEDYLKSTNEDDDFEILSLEQLINSIKFGTN